jgi:protoheme IX farnesyltransferase
VLAAALGAWFLVEAHGLNARVRAGQTTGSATGSAPDIAPDIAPGIAPENAPSPAPMRLFHLSIAYLTLLFAAVAVTALLPWGRW